MLLCNVYRQISELKYLKLVPKPSEAILNIYYSKNYKTKKHETESVTFGKFNNNTKLFVIHIVIVQIRQIKSECFLLQNYIHCNCLLKGLYPG